MGLAVDKASFELTNSGTGSKPHRWTKIGSSGKESRQYTCPFCTGWTHTETDYRARAGHRAAEHPG